MQQAEKAMKRAPVNDINRNNKQTKESKSCLQDVDTMEEEVTTPTVKKNNNTISLVLETRSSANAGRKN